MRAYRCSQPYRNINICTTSIKQSKSDADVFKLYNLVIQNYPNLNKVEHLYKTLEQQRVKGWLIIRAKILLNL